MGPFRSAVIVAAGRATRLRPLTDDTPKCLLPIAGEPLLVRATRLLHQAGVERIAVVVGYRQEQVRAAVQNRCECVVNPFFPLCNNMGSLWFARQFVGGAPFVYLHGDLVFEPSLLETALAEASRAEDDIRLVTEFGPVDAEAMKVRTDEARLLLDVNKEIPLEAAAGEWIGMALVRNSRRLFEVVEERLLGGDYERYDAIALEQLAEEGAKIRCVPTGGRAWREVDFATDYEAARRLFETTAEVA
jgi:choline kinase